MDCLVFPSFAPRLVTSPRHMRVILKKESRAAARKPRDAVAVLFGLSSPTTFTTTSKRVAKLRFGSRTSLLQNTMPQNKT